MKETLNQLYKGQVLTRTEAEDIMTRIGRNSYSDIEISSFLTVYLIRGITPGELAGFRDALLELCRKVDLNGYQTIDVVLGVEGVLEYRKASCCRFLKE